MNEQTRYRVTGTLFLVAVAIIVLPMVFDGAGVRVQPLPELPPAAEPPPATADLTRYRIPSADAASHDAELAAARARVDDGGFDAADGTLVGDPTLVESTESASAGDPSSAAAQAVPPASHAPGERPAAALAKTPIWAVQLASFASADNARGFRDTLLADGFEAWTSTAKRNQAVRTRVVVGPLLDKADARRLRDQMSERYDIDAILVEIRP